MSRSRLSILLIALAALAVLSLPAFADSQARIVRLSSVEGGVQIDRNTGQGFEKAFLNFPIIQGTKIQTKSDGKAEVEFEDGSTLRMVPNTVIEFTQLSLRDSGTRVSAVQVKEGSAYVNFDGKKTDEFTLTFGRESVKLGQAAHFRVQMRDADAALAVFKGDVEVSGTSGDVQIGKKHEATFDLADNNRYTLADNLEPDPFDTWDKQQDQYHKQYAKNSSYNSPYGYGASDLNYYGSFFNAPGHGMMWQPYFADASWNPFMDGMWAWYPGFGYTWVSGYPWGWMPYYYGSWMFVPSYGWAWQPGNTWMTWNTVPRVVNLPASSKPLQPPTSGRGTVIVGRGGSVSPAASSKLVVANGSAGLGIPRGRISNMNSLSAEAKQKGSVTAKVHSRPVAPSMPSSPQPPSAGMSVPASSSSMGTRTSMPTHSAGHSGTSRGTPPK